MARTLHSLAWEEQRKGQKGLSKFLTLWKPEAHEPDLPHFPTPTLTPPNSWTVVSSVNSANSQTSQASSPEVVAKEGVGNLMISPPRIYGRESDRKAGAREETYDPMAKLTQAIQNQTSEIASLVRNQQEGGIHPQGSIKGLSKMSEELVYLMRACDQYDVKVCPGDVGSALANALLSAQVGASTKLRALGFRKKISARLAVGLAGPYWGTSDKFALSAADFVQVTDAELDAFASESRTTKQQSEQRPAPPTRLDDWVSRVTRQNQVWALTYGMEWLEVRQHALELLSGWHQELPHKWPLQIVMEAWEELHWRFIEEMKELLRQLKKTAKRESMSLSEIRFHALLPGPDGRAWLELPRTFDLLNPNGWFKVELEPRIERRQERALWRLTWGGDRKQGPGLHAGGGKENEEGRGGGKANPTMLGPKLTQEEVNRARDRAPVSKGGTLLCWGYLTHSGCSSTTCQRAHEGLRGTLEALDPAVQMQLIRRGGLKRMKPESQESAKEKIQQLRHATQKDKAAKMAKPKRKAGAEHEEQNDEAENTKAGGHPGVRFNDIPEEFEAVDYTKQEDVQDFVRPTKQCWGIPVPHQNRGYWPPPDFQPPEGAAKMVQEAEQLSQGPVLGLLQGASDDLYAWASARVAKDPNIQFEEPMGEMAAYGVADLANEAAAFMDKQGTTRAGENARLTVRDTMWVGGEAGQGCVELDGTTWRSWDYQEEVLMTEELAGILQIPEPVPEKRQCVTKTLAAGSLWREKGRRPSLEEVEKRAQEMRLDQARLAVEAQSQMGEPAEFITPIEHELRVYLHDLLHPAHERDFRSLAVFPVTELADAKIIVVRADYGGNLVVESVVGPAWEKGGWLVWTMIWRGHMVLLQPPPDFNEHAWLAIEEKQSTPVLGFNFYWHARHDQPVSAPGRIACRLCRPPRRAGDQDPLLPDLVRQHSTLAAAATVHAGSGGVNEPSPGAQVRGVRPAGTEAKLLFRELFAGTAGMTKEWVRQGGEALPPVELYQDPHNRQGRQPQHDLSDPMVRGLHLQRASDGPENVFWIASPCTTFCDWQLQNGGTRTFQCPEGGGRGAILEKEIEGNIFGNFAAQAFLNALEAGAYPVAESSGPSGRYPKMWDLEAWRNILKRPDVSSAVFPMCAFGLGPPDDKTAFYRHTTRLVFPSHSPLAQVLHRLCPGLSAQHRHIPLKGCRPGLAVTRCTEAGA